MTPEDWRSFVEEAGFEASVVDYSFFHFSPGFYEHIDQIRRVEELSDAYHLRFGDEDVMVMYLLEITHRAAQDAASG